MDEISINSGIRRIKVNKKGDCIDLKLGDQAFAPGFFEMLDRINKKIDEEQPHAMEMDKKYKNASQLERYRAMAEYNKTLHKMMRSEVDAFFGEGTCQKVFGDIIPHYSMYFEFFEALKTVIADYAQERSEKMAKYSLGRQGNV